MLWCSPLISVFSVGNSIEFLGFNYHLQKKKKKFQGYTFNWPVLSAQPLFPSVSWTPCQGSPQAAQIQNVHKEICDSTLVSNSCITRYHLVCHHHHHHHHRHPMREAQNPSAASSPQFPLPISTACTCHLGPSTSLLLLKPIGLLEPWHSQWVPFYILLFQLFYLKILFTILRYLI